MSQHRRHRVDTVQREEIVPYIKRRPGWCWLPLRDHGDGLFRCGWWPIGFHLLLEVKDPKNGKLRPGQVELSDHRHTIVIRSVEDLERIVNAASRELDKVNVKFTEGIYGPSGFPNPSRTD